MKKLLISICLSLLLLNGCAFFTHKEKPANIVTDKVIQLDPKVLEPCMPLVLLRPDITDFSEVLANAAINAKVYADCSSKQDTSITLLKKFSNKG
jgi:hypothetical protein